jgi:hypothetical protein
MQPNGSQSASVFESDYTYVRDAAQQAPNLSATVQKLIVSDQSRAFINTAGA